MNNEIIDMQENIPALTSKKCKLLSYLLRLFLQFGVYLFGGIALYLYDYFIAIMILILAFVIMGIIRSYIRNSVVLLQHRELQYSDKEISDLFILKNICYSTNS